MRKRVLAVLPLAVVLGLTLVMADGGANHQSKQSGAVKLGTSGGNVEDHSSAFCCSGTLGALVEDVNGTDYILSNNHVLGLLGNATPNDQVSQPGLIDVGCNANNANIVGRFWTAAELGTSNVDAALALVTGNVSTTGEILDIGVPSSTTATAAVNMQVAKSGRTTGFTCGNISSINTNVSVQYQDGCGKGKKFVVTYTDQVVISGSSFSAGGDSGSLIVTAADSQPVALLFAGSSSTTIGNPIQDVLNALDNLLPGISFVGGGNHSAGCPTGGNDGGGGGGGKPCKGKNCSGGGRSEQGRVTMEQALAAKRQYARSLMQDEAVQGVGVGIDDDGEPVVVIYLEQGRAHQPLPQMMLGVRAKVVVTDRFRASGWNERLMPAGACKAN